MRQANSFSFLSHITQFVPSETSQLHLCTYRRRTENEKDWMKICNPFNSLTRGFKLTTQGSIRKVHWPLDFCNHWDSGTWWHSVWRKLVRFFILKVHSHYCIWRVRIQQMVAFLQGDRKFPISALMQSTVENADCYI